MTSGLLLLVVLLVGNAVFVAAEFALLSAQRARIEMLAREGNRRAQAVLDDLRHLNVMLAGTQLGVTACSVALGYVGEPAVAYLIEGAVGSFAAVPVDVVRAVGFAVALALVTVLHMVLGEMVPKNLTLAAPERSALVLGPFMAVFTRVFRPVLWLLNGLANVSLRIVGITPRSETKSAYTSAELRGVIAESVREGALDQAGEVLLTSALDLERTTAGALMLPRERLVTLSGDATIGDLQQALTTYRFSRYPVERAGELVGFVHVKDLLQLPAVPPSAPLPASWVRPFVPVPRDLPVDDLLATMQAGRTHLASVVDEDGRCLGVVPLEQVLEAFVGEIVGELPAVDEARRS